MLIFCPECNKQVSDKAFFCPNCGFPFVKVEFINSKVEKAEEKKEINQVNSNITKTSVDEHLNKFSGVYTVEEIQKLLRIGRKQAYELVNSGQFPCKKLGRKFLIPKKTFDQWFLGNEVK